MIKPEQVYIYTD